MKRLKVIFLAVFAVTLIAGGVAPAVPAMAASSAALSIVPRKDYTIEPGKGVKDTLVIRNIDTERSLDLTLRIVDFTYNDDGGTPKLLLDEDAERTAWSLRQYMTVPKKVTIEPNGSKTVDMSVNMPSHIGGGSYYSAIVYSSGASDGGNVGLSASGVTLAFVTVPGEVKEDLQLERFGAYHAAAGSQKASYVFFGTTTQPKMFAYTLKNNGNVAGSPAGTITYKPLFGKEKIITQVNPNNSLALIGQSRVFTACLITKQSEVDFNGTRTRSTTCEEPKLWPGLYHATLDLYYGQNGNQTKDINGSTWFFYLPWWFIFLLAVVVTAASYYGYKAYNNIRNKFYGPKPGRRKSRR